MADSNPEIVLLLFVTRTNRSAAESNVRQALRGWSASYHLATFDVDSVPELAEKFRIIGTPTLVCEQFEYNRVTRLVGLADPELIRTFVSDGLDDSTFDTNTIPFIAPNKSQRA